MKYCALESYWVCIYIIYILYINFIYIVYIFYIYCIYIVYILYIYCIYIVYILYIYCIYIVYILYIYCIYIVYILYIYCIYMHGACGSRHLPSPVGTSTRHQRVPAAERGQALPAGTCHQGMCHHCIYIYIYIYVYVNISYILYICEFNI